MGTKNDEPTVALSYRMPKYLHEAVKEIAEQQDRSLTKMLNIIVENATKKPQTKSEGSPNGRIT